MEKLNINRIIFHIVEDKEERKNIKKVQIDIDLELTLSAIT